MCVTRPVKNKKATLKCATSSARQVKTKCVINKNKIPSGPTAQPTAKQHRVCCMLWIWWNEYGPSWTTLKIQCTHVRLFELHHTTSWHQLSLSRGFFDKVNLALHYGWQTFCSCLWGDKWLECTSYSNWSKNPPSDVMFPLYPLPIMTQLVLTAWRNLAKHPYTHISNS